MFFVYEFEVVWATPKENKLGLNWAKLSSNWNWGLLYYIDDYQLPLQQPVNLLDYLHAYLLSYFPLYLPTTVNSNRPKSHTSYPLNFHRLYLVNFKFMIYLPR